MEILVSELAEKLNISTKSAIELYPVLREQFVVYEILDAPIKALSVLNIVFLVSSLIFLVFLWDEYGKEGCKSIQSLLKKSVIALVVVFLMYTALKTTSIFLSPDIYIIKEFIGGV